MAANGVFFLGRFTRVPASLSQIDASELEALGLGSIGIVSLLGTARGGKPVSALTKKGDEIRITRPEQSRQIFKSGDLREACVFTFDPARDPDITGGASQIVPMKVNPATQSSLTLSNADGPAMILTSQDYGADADQISWSLGNGTVQGKLATLVFETITQSSDNIGGSAVFGLQYDENPGIGWDTMTARVLSSGIRASGTRAETGKSTDVTAGIQSVVTVVSSDNADTTQQITIYGLVGGTPVREVLTLQGTTPVNGTTLFDASSVFAAGLSAAAVGTVTVKDSFPTTMLTLAPAALATGGVQSSAMFVAGSALSLVLDAAGTENVWLVGRTTSGAVAISRQAMNGTSPVASAVTNFAQIDFIVLGELPAARTVTISGTAVLTANTVQTNVTKAADYYNARQVTVGVNTYGFTFTIKTSLVSLLISDMDLLSSEANIDGAEADFYADLFFLIDWVNTNSSLVTAARATGATGVPDNTAAPVYLSGGGEGTPTFSDYQAALDFLKKIRVNTIVPLSPDPAVHAALEAHLQYRAGLGKSEADGIVGLMNAAMTGLATKTEIKSQITSLNSRHLRAVAQSVDRFNTSGERETFDPHFLAAILAGAQAGSPIGTALTHKVINSLAVGNHSSWDPVGDAEEMIEAGLCFVEDVDGIGRRVVRNITTHLSTSNLAFVEAGVNEAANFASFTFRTEMEFAVGKRNFNRTVGSLKAKGVGVLGLLTQDPDPVLTAWRSLDITTAADVAEVSAEIAPITSLNFILTTLHLVTTQLSAAA